MLPSCSRQHGPAQQRFEGLKECPAAAELTDDLLVPLVVKLSTADCKVCMSRVLTTDNSFGTAGLGPLNGTLVADAADVRGGDMMK